MNCNIRCIVHGGTVHDACIMHHARGKVSALPFVLQFHSTTGQDRNERKEGHHLASRKGAGREHHRTFLSFSHFRSLSDDSPPPSIYPRFHTLIHFSPVRLSFLLPLQSPVTTSKDPHPHPQPHLPSTKPPNHFVNALTTFAAMCKKKMEAINEMERTTTTNGSLGVLVLTFIGIQRGIASEIVEEGKE